MELTLCNMYPLVDALSERVNLGNPNKITKCRQSEKFYYDNLYLHKLINLIYRLKTSVQN